MLKILRSVNINNYYRDLILGHSLQGMDVHYMAPDDETLRQAMEKYTSWLDDQIANVDQSVDQEVKHKNIKGPNGR
jgi:vacuolar-type H+-ATPase subunit F/Vma7